MKKEKTKKGKKIQKLMEMQRKKEQQEKFKKIGVYAKKPELFDEELCFTDGRKIQIEHRQCCCEHNYADWSSLDDTGFYEENFYNKRIVITEWEGGFRINNYSVNCYSSQNGWYSADLEIKVIDECNDVAEYLMIDCEVLE